MSTWAASNDRDHKRLRYMLSFDRDVTRTLLETFNATAAWTAYAGNAAGLAVDTVNFREGTAALKWNKTSTATGTSSALDAGYWTSTATAQNWSSYDLFTFDVRCTSTAALATATQVRLRIGDATGTSNYQEWAFAGLHAGWNCLTATRTRPTSTAGTCATLTAVRAWGVAWKGAVDVSVFTGFTVDNLRGVVLGAELPVLSNGAIQHNSWAVDYLASAGLKPAAATPAWSRTGVDHEAISADGVRIKNCGTDLDHNGLTYAAPSADPIWAKAVCKCGAGAPSGVTVEALLFGHATHYVYALIYDGAININGTVYACDTVTAARTIKACLNVDGTFECWIDGSSVLAGVATAGANQLIRFGKSSASSTNIAYWWSEVAYAFGRDPDDHSTPWTYLKKASPLVGTVVPNKAERSVRSLSVDALDVDGSVSTLIATTEMRNRIGRLYVGYDDVDEQDFLELFVGQVTSLAFRDGVWSISLGDLRRTLKSTIFNASATTPVVFTAWNPIDLMLYIWCNGDYLGMDPELIDWDAIYEIRDSYFPASPPMNFDVREPWEAKAFVESQILDPLSCYLIQTGSGQLSLKYVTAPLYADRTGTLLDESNIIGIPTVDYGLRDMLNEIFWCVGYDAATGEFASKTLYIDADSLESFEESKRFSVEAQGMAVTDATFIASRNARIFGRFAKPYPRYKVKSHLSQCTIREGDLIQILHPKLPNLSTDKDSDTPHLVEVLSASVDVERCRCEFELLDTPWSFSRTVVISILSTDYSAWTADDRDLYGAVGDASDNHVGTADEGYLIQEG